MNSDRKGTFQDLNALFVFGALSVLAIHILGFFVENQQDYPWNGEIETVLLILLRFGRSLFIFATGMLLFYWYQQREMNWAVFWKKRFRVIIVPYVIWTAIFTCFKLQTVDPSVLAVPFLDSLFTGSAFYHLYYIPLYLQLCLLFCLIKPWFERFLRFRTLVVLFVGQIGLYGIYNYLFIHPLWEIDWAASPLLTFFQHTYVAGQNYVHMYIFTFALGAYAGLNLEKWRAWTWRLQVPACIVTLITALCIANDFVSGSKSYYESLNIFNPLYLLYTTSFLISFYSLSRYLGKLPKFGQWLSDMARQNMAIYLVHPLILFLLESYVIFRLDWSTPWIMLAMFVVTPPLCIFLYEHTLVSHWMRGKGKATSKPLYKTEVYKA
ncbi:acyltransferase [Brevibacillus parabrevis]|uniref:Acyltransferase 3 n=1 Tax=Brevibacillus parabrevis TaxID=54914 RepID=A0A4Y3P8Y2_BREPA|nr:acyltransferase [Brevibacillus parabrevis]MBU8711317.1 acyltransferase [Brevibacillus parabrevis]RNB94379.1 acyltransferase [Brevibacillus parabrevis]WDV93152.1 acyltransferase [Brevibacillus parabrevis]GEB30852.1 acyltransferase 3 [Brevibacillus parabrevis]